MWYGRRFEVRGVVPRRCGALNLRVCTMQLTVL